MLSPGHHVSFLMLTGTFGTYCLYAGVIRTSAWYCSPVWSIVLTRVGGWLKSRTDRRKSSFCLHTTLGTIRPLLG
jgi:hypothetical protein